MQIHSHQMREDVHFRPAGGGRPLVAVAGEAEPSQLQDLGLSAKCRASSPGPRPQHWLKATWLCKVCSENDGPQFPFPGANLNAGKIAVSGETNGEL